jgi:hypothetical protein
MDKEIEELKNIVVIHFGALGFLNPSENEQILKDRDKVLNALTTKSKKEQAFDIIKEYQVDTWLLNQCDYENYIRIRKEARVSIGQIINEDGESVEEEISEEEFNLLKEVLNDNPQE